MNDYILIYISQAVFQKFTAFFVPSGNIGLFV
nr:MAG TPA: hypothetical protein [Caudoviricetes sp.]